MKKRSVFPRFLSLLLATVMTFYFVGVTAFATSDNAPVASGSGLSADDPMAVSGEALVYDSSQGIVGFSENWYNSLNLDDKTLYVSLTIPAEMNNTPVTKIAYQALQYKNNGFRNETDVLKDDLKNIKIVYVDFTQATNLTEIGQYAFDQRPELSGEINLGYTNITAIGAGAFRGTAITGVILPDTLQELGDVNIQAGTFAQCSALTYVKTTSASESSEAVVLPDGLTTIGKQCFRYSFTRGSRIAITIPASVEKIGAEAFNACGDGNYGEICQLNVMRTSDFNGYDAYAFQSKTIYPAIYISKAAYDAAKSSSIRDGSGSATMTYILNVEFKYNDSVIKTEQKLYNMYLLYEKDTNGIWSQNNDYGLPVPDGLADGMTADWKYSSSGTTVSTDDKLQETAEPVVITASRAVPVTPVINGILPASGSVHEDGIITLSLDISDPPTGMAYAYEWIMYDENSENGQKAMGSDSSLTLTYKEAKGNYFAAGVTAYLLSDKETVSEQAVYGWFTVSTTAHNWPSTWTVDREATAEVDGLQHKTCTITDCGKTIWESIPAIGSVGSITKAVEIGPGAPQTEMLNTKEELSKLLTEDEKQAIDSGGGSHARIWLEVQKLAVVPTADTDAITAKAKALLGGSVNILPFDISLYAQIDSNAQRKITETNTPIRMTLTVPEGLRETQWYLIRVHNGEAEQVDGVYNSQAGTLTIQANRFSTYAFAYADVYTVTFDGNGANGQAPASIYVRKGASFTAPDAGAMTKNGFHFAGWAKQANAQKADYLAGANVTDITTNTTLYAVWEQNTSPAWEYSTYQVVFNANGGTGTMQPQSFIYGDEKALTANAFTKTGYTFAGWATEQNGTLVYTDAQQVKNLTAVQGGIVNLYAVWKPNTYQTVFNANGSTGAMQPQDFTYDETKALTANTFTKTGYTFAGWATEQNGTVVYTDAQQVKNLTAIQGETVNLYAVWKPNTYRVAFKANGGTGTMQPQDFTYDETKSLTKNAFIRKGYSFAGWATEQNGTVVYTDAQQVKNLTTVQGETVNLHAVWKADAKKPSSAATTGGTNQPPATGDTTDLYLMFALMLVSGAGIAVLLRRKKE